MDQSDTKANPWLAASLAAAMLLTLVAANWPLFRKLIPEWAPGDDSYCYLIFPLFFYLLWQEHRNFRFQELTPSFMGTGVALLAVGSLLLGELGSMITLLFIGVWACLLAMAVALYGRRIAQLIFPFLLLLFITPLPPYLNNLLTFRLKMAASAMSVHMLRLTGIQVMLEGNIIDLGVEKLQVVDACSGLRYFMPMLVMALLVGHFFAGGRWRRLVLLAMVVPLSVMVNALRIWLTGFLTTTGHQELAQSLFHDFSGELMFMIAAVLLIVIAAIMNKMGGLEKQKDQTPEATRNRVMPPIWSTLLLPGILCILFAASGWAMHRLPSVQPYTGRTSFASFPMQIGDWLGQRDYLSPEILESLWADDYLLATYTKPGSLNRISLLIPYYGYQNSRHTAHAPQACLLGGGFALLESRDRLVRMGKDDEKTIRSMVLSKGEDKLLAGYFFLQRGRVITSPWLNKLYLIWDSMARQRTDGALVRLEMEMAPGQSEEEARGLLDGFLAELWPLLAAYVPE